jgi:putative selenate reductase
VYEGPSDVFEYTDVELLPDGSVRTVPGGALVLVQGQQLANYADACNECGNCDVLCPEDGGPFVAKPRFFGSLVTYYRYAGNNGFYVAFAADHKTIYGTIEGRSYRLTVDPEAGRACFDEGQAEIDVQLAGNEALSWKPKPGAPTNVRTVDMLPFLQLKLMLESVSDPRHVHFANVAGLEETAVDQASAIQR